MVKSNCLFFPKKSPFSSSLIFRKSQNFRRLKSSKIKGLRLKNQTVCYNQTGRLNTKIKDLCLKNQTFCYNQTGRLNTQKIRIKKEGLKPS